MELSPFTATPTRSPQRAAKNLLIVATATLVYVVPEPHQRSPRTRLKLRCRLVSELSQASTF